MCAGVGSSMPGIPRKRGRWALRAPGPTGPPSLFACAGRRPGLCPHRGIFRALRAPAQRQCTRFRGLKPASRCSLALAAGQDYRPKGRFSGRSKPLDPQPTLEAGGENEIDFVCCEEGGRKEKYAPEIRDRSHTARNQASLILADVFYRYAADAALATVNRRHFRRCMLFQTTETSIVVCYRRYRTTKAQASRVGLRSRPSIAKR